MTNSIKNWSLLVIMLIITLIILTLVFCQRVFYFVDMQQQYQSSYDNLQNQQMNARSLEQLLIDEERTYTHATQSGFLNEPDVHHCVAQWRRLAQQCAIKDINFNVKAPHVVDFISTQIFIITVKADLDSDVFKFVSLLEQQKTVLTLVQDITLFRDQNDEGLAVSGVQAQIICTIFHSIPQ